MATRYQESFEFGNLNPVRSTAAKEYLQDDLPGSGLKALGRFVSQNFEQNSLAGLGQELKGIVLLAIIVSLIIALSTLSL